MNIFILDNNINKNVQMYNDFHIRKMGIEACQMLGNCFTLEELKQAPLTQKGEYRKYAHYNIPLSKWVREIKGNFLYTFKIAEQIFYEYTYRFGKEHFTQSFLVWVLKNSHIALSRIKNNEQTPFVLAMPDQYKCDDVVKSYQNYYLAEKLTNKAGKKATWTKRPIPNFVKEKEND